VKAANSRLRPRTTVLGGAALIFATLLAAAAAGCGGDDSGDGGSASKTGSSRIVYAVTSTPPDIDPNSSAQFVESELFTNTMSRLFDFKTTKRDDGTYVMESEGYDPVDGSLAESWTVSEDRKTIDIKLRQGVKNHLGNEFDAKDVRYTIDRLLALKGTGTFYLNGIGITKPSNLEIVDPHTIRFKLDYPAVLFFKMMAIPHLGIMDSVEMKKHATDDDPWATSWAKSNNVGWGPYYITQNQQGVQVALKRDPEFWKGPAPVETVIMKEVPSSANRLSLLKGGSVDVVAYLQPRERISLEKDSNVKVVSFEPAQTHSILYMTTTKKPFDDPRVRQAVCYALPYDDIVQNVGLGTARRQHGPLPANYQFYAPELDPYKQDVAKAKQLLSEAGFPNGFETSIGFSNDDPTVEQQASSVQNALASIGIRAKLLKQPFATYSQNWLGAKYEMGMMYEGAFIPDYTYALNLWYYGPKSANFLNFTDYHSKEVNAMLDEARSTFDEAKREELAKGVQKQILEDAPICYLVEPGVHLPARKNIGGINYWTYSAQHFDQWTKDEN
jgi:peptide/nickel transport system substrate-binding protein